MRQDKVSFMHFRHYSNQLEPKGGITVAYSITQDFSHIQFDYAECNEKDHYNRRIGNKISGGRLNKFGGHPFECNPSTWFEDFELYLLQHAEANDGCRLVNTSRSKAK